MRDVILSQSAYNNARDWLRTTQIVWRDMGSSSLVPSWNESLCDERFCVNEVPATKIAWDVIGQYYPAMVLNWRKEELSLLDMRPPQKFRGVVIGDLYYLDIRAAYATLYEFLFFHSDWPFKRQKYPLRPIAQHFRELGPDYKLPRNCVAGIIRSIRNKWVQGEKVWYTFKKNRFLSPTLWGQLVGIMTEFAYQMDKLGAIWYNTDGYCFRSHSAYQIALSYFSDLGIEVYHGSGMGEIRGLNSLNIPGVKCTESLTPSSPVFHLEQLEGIEFYKLWDANRKGAI